MFGDTCWEMSNMYGKYHDNTYENLFIIRIKKHMKTPWVIQNGNCKVVLYSKFLKKRSVSFFFFFLVRVSITYTLRTNNLSWVNSLK